MARPKLLIPDPGADRLRPLPLALTAILPFAVGVWLVNASLEEGEQVAVLEAEAAGAPGDVTGSDTESAPAPESESESVPESESESESDSAPESDSTPESEAVPAPASIPRRVGLGRIAYLKCDGAPPAPGPFPCPRDRDLEATVWTALEALPECASLPTQTGPGDLRLTFVPGAPVEIATRSRGPESLPEEALLACLSEPLSNLATNIRADDLLVSFHFALINADH